MDIYHTFHQGCNLLILDDYKIYVSGSNGNGKLGLGHADIYL